MFLQLIRRFFNFQLILQTAEVETPSLITFIGGNSVLSRVFGNHSAPFTKYRVRDLLFDGIAFCANPTLPISLLFCREIRARSVRSSNLEVMDDGSIVFSLFGHVSIDTV